MAPATQVGRPPTTWGWKDSPVPTLLVASMAAVSLQPWSSAFVHVRAKTVTTAMTRQTFKRLYPPWYVFDCFTGLYSSTRPFLAFLSLAWLGLTWNCWALLCLIGPYFVLLSLTGPYGRGRGGQTQVGKFPFFIAFLTSLYIDCT